jgi:hypothetical protein
MKKVIFIWAACALAHAAMASADSTCPHIIEFGPVDEPCRLSVLTDCNTCYEFAWFCDGAALLDSNTWWNVAISGTHDYKIIVTSSDRCTDSAQVVVSDRGCEMTSISEPNESPVGSIIGYCDLSGQELFFDPRRKNKFRGICIVLFRTQTGIEARKIFLNK